MSPDDVIDYLKTLENGHGHNRDEIYPYVESYLEVVT